MVGSWRPIPRLRNPETATGWIELISGKAEKIRITHPLQARVVIKSPVIQKFSFLHLQLHVAGSGICSHDVT